MFYNFFLDNYTLRKTQNKIIKIQIGKFIIYNKSRGKYNKISQAANIENNLKLQKRILKSIIA